MLLVGSVEVSELDWREAGWTTLWEGVDELNER